MTFVVGKSRNPMLAAAWAGFKKEQRAEKKAPTEPADVHTNAPKAKPITPDVHRKAGKVNTSAKKTRPPARAKAGKTNRR